MTSSTVIGIRDAALPPAVTLPPADAVVVPSAAARFGEDVWDLRGGFTTPNAKRATLDWTRIASEPLRTAWKALAFVRLRDPVGQWIVLKPESLPTFHAAALRASELLWDLGIHRPGEITPAIGDALVRAAADREWASEYAQAVLNAVVQLYDLRVYLPEAPARHPLGGKGPKQRLGRATRDRYENSTERVPEHVMGPVLIWALRYLDFADEILAADARPGRRVFGHRQHRDTTLPKLAHAIAELRAAGRGLPTKAPGQLQQASGHWHGRTDAAVAARIDLSELAIMAGAHLAVRARNARLIALLDEALQELGLEGDRPLRPDEEETLASLRGGSSWTTNGVQEEKRRLALACYIVIAYLTGMRDSEVLGLQRGCLRRGMSRDGLRTRWYIDGHVFKHRRAPEPATWVAIEPVVRAVQTLERLHDGAIQPRGSAARKGGPPPARHRIVATSLMPPMVEVSAIRLNDWCAHVNLLQRRSPSRPPIPEWSLNSRQLRRTLAWYIANRPGGVIAGMIQYQQASMEIFEGYAGRAKSGFRMEVHAEEQFAKLVELQDLYHEWEGGVRLQGSGAGEVVAAFEEVQAAMRLEVNPTDRRLREMLKDKSVHLHVGVLSDCRFREEEARCLQVASQPRDGKRGPLLNVCNKATCGHSVLGPKHVALWQQCVKDTEELLQNPHLSGPQRAILEEERRRQLAVIGEGEPT